MRLPLLITTILLAACSGEAAQSRATVNGDSTGPTASVSDTLTPAVPVANQEPIPYPADLFDRRIEGKVMLYLVVDSTGRVVADSTRIETSSGQASFDAAALTAAPELRFTPAHIGATAVTAPVKVPIVFSLPDSLQVADSQ